MAIFHSIIEAVEQQRPGYAASIGYTPDETEAPTGIPDGLGSIFNFAIGTPHGVADQRMMDLLPGYRLMLASEIPAVRQQLQDFYGADDLFNVQSRTPFLANYSSDYYLADDDDNGVYWLDHQGGTSRVSPNVDTFLRTTLRCYQQGAYRMASDGMLEMDDELELQIALRLNPDCDYWLE